MVQVGRNTNGTETLCQNSQWNTLEVSRYARLVKKKKNVSDKNYLEARNLKKFKEV